MATYRICNQTKAIVWYSLKNWAKNVAFRMRALINYRHVNYADGHCPIIDIIQPTYHYAHRHSHLSVDRYRTNVDTTTIVQFPIANIRTMNIIVNHQNTITYLKNQLTIITMRSHANCIRSHHCATMK